MNTINYSIARNNMVTQQIRPWDVFDPKVLDLFAQVHREDFVPDEFRHLAYSDTGIPLGTGHFLAPPREQARMLQALAPQPTDRALEIGTGSGFITLLLAHLVKDLVSVDIDPSVIPAAKMRLETAGITRVEFKVGDAAPGWTQDGQFDLICIHGSIKSLPQSYKEQLTIGGRLFAIIGDKPAMSATLITRLNEKEWRTEVLFETVVPRLVHGEPKPEFEF